VQTRSVCRLCADAGRLLCPCQLSDQTHLGSWWQGYNHLPFLTAWVSKSLRDTGWVKAGMQGQCVSGCIPVMVVELLYILKLAGFHIPVFVTVDAACC
jgi:hypothetical protein